MAHEFTCNLSRAARSRRREVGTIELSEAVYAAGASIPVHCHAAATVCLVLDGAYEERFPATSFRCEPGSVIFSPPGEVHGDVFGDVGGRCFAITVPEATLSEWVDGGRLSGSLEPRQGGPSRSAFELRQRFRRDSAPRAEDVEELALALLDEVHSRATVRATGRPPRWLRGIRNRVHEEFRRLPSLEELAADAGVHRVHAARAFRRHFGCTIGDYARRRRVEHACTRLREPDGSLSAIAYESGFADQSHMTRTLRQVLHTTPRAFRERYRD